MAPATQPQPTLGGGASPPPAQPSGPPRADSRAERAHRLAPLLSSAHADWCTPDPVLELVRLLGPIGLDPCSNERSIVGARVEWTAHDDGLARSWAGFGLVYVNPPYGRKTIAAWAAKCHAQGRRAEVVALLPARTDTRWWQMFCAPPGAQAVCFLAGRIRFLGARSHAP